MRRMFDFTWWKATWEEGIWVARRCCFTCLSQAFTASPGALGCHCSQDGSLCLA